MLRQLLWLTLVVTALIHHVQAQECPTTQELQKLRDSLDGSLVLPGDKNYWKAGEMKGTNYNSDFNFILYAESQEDVKRFVKFVRRFGLRPTVRSSGHDYIGRSGGDNTNNLSFEKYKKVTVNLNDGDSSTGASMRASSGNAWIDLYKEADKNNKVVLGGSAHTVAMGGYFQGGGHSPLSPKLGLGVDQIISFTMVTVDGDVMEVNKNSYTFENGTSVADPEVFRAVMGGGGGVFGFVTFFRMKLHEPPTDGFVQLTAHFALTTPTVNFSDIVIDKYSKLFLSLNENWGGFFLLRPDTLDARLYRGTLSLVLLHWGGMDKAEGVIDDVKAFRPDLNPVISVEAFPTFLKYEESVYDETGFRTLVANRFLQNSDLQANVNLQKLAGRSLDYKIDLACTGVLIGHKTKEANAATSVSDKFRNGRLAFSCGTGWGEADQDELYKTQFTKFIRDHLYTMGQGTYYNEPHANLTNWKIDYWGNMENYNRLLAVKKKLDPTSVLWCHHCVGSDETKFTTPCPSGINSATVVGPVLFVQLIVTILIISLN